MRSLSARSPLCGQQRAELRRQRAGQGLAHPGRHLLGRAFGGLERDVAGEALDHHDIDDALADLVAFDEAAVVDRQVVLLQPGMRLPDLLDALDLLDADVEQPHARPLDVQDGAGHGGAHQREVGELARRGADIGAEVEDDAGCPTSVGHCPAMAGRSMPGMVVRTSLAMAIRAPVLPAETMKSASRFVHGLERQPHAGRAPAAHGLARLVLHLHDGIGVHDARALGEGRMPLEMRR